MASSFWSTPYSLGGERLESTIGLVEEVRGDRQVNGGGVDPRMPQKRAQVDQAIGRVDPLSIEAQQASHREGMPQVMGSWRATPPLRESKARSKKLKGGTDAIRADG